VARPYAQAALDELAACGVPVPDVDGDTLPVADYLALLNLGRAQTGEDFGWRVGARMRTASFVAYGHAVLSCPRFDAAIALTQRFEGLAHDLGRSELVIDGERAHYRWHSPWLAAHPCPALPESVMAGILAFATWLAQRPLPVRGLAFPHAAPSPAVREAIDQRLGLLVAYGAPVTQATVPASFLHEAIPTADPALFPLLEQHAAQQLAVREQALRATDARTAWAAQVQRAIAERLAHDGARLNEVAQALGLSARTLQRRLAEAGTPFQGLLDATRRELAQHYLRDETLSLTEVAFLLGYAEQSSFNHACRGWFGESPGRVRASLRRGVRGV
jgi:AraC-like DNA-binding protein